MKKAEVEKMDGGTLVQVLKDGGIRSGQVGQFRCLIKSGNAAVLINGKMAYLPPERLERYVKS